MAVDRESDRLTVTLDHPESGNAIDRYMRDQPRAIGVAIADALVLAGVR